MEKFREYKKTIIITSIITLLPIVVGLALWNKLPNEFATHFDTNGDPDGWSSKTFAVFGLPVLMVAIQLVCTFATCLDPKRHKIGDKVFKLVLWIIPLLSWFTLMTTYSYNLGVNLNTASYTIVFIGIIFIVIGNYLPKCRQNYTIGIKIPWTLHDEDNWNHTHRFAGKIWMIGGVVIALLALVGLGNTWFLPAIIIVFILIPIAYSFLYYMKHK